MRSAYIKGGENDHEWMASKEAVCMVAMEGHEDEIEQSVEEAGRRE